MSCNLLSLSFLGGMPTEPLIFALPSRLPGNSRANLTLKQHCLSSHSLSFLSLSNAQLETMLFFTINNIITFTEEEIVRRPKWKRIDSRITFFCNHVLQVEGPSDLEPASLMLSLSRNSVRVTWKSCKPFRPGRDTIYLCAHSGQLDLATKATCILNTVTFQYPWGLLVSIPQYTELPRLPGVTCKIAVFACSLNTSSWVAWSTQRDSSSVSSSSLG